MEHDIRCQPTDLELGYHCALCGAWEPDDGINDALVSVAVAERAIRGVVDLAVDYLTPEVVVAAVKDFQREAGPVLRALLAVARTHRAVTWQNRGG